MSGRDRWLTVGALLRARRRARTHLLVGQRPSAESLKREIRVRSKVETVRAMAKALRVPGIVLLIAVCVEACGGIDPRVVGAAAEEFHQKFNAGQFSEIYESADPSFRAATPRTSFASAMAGLKSSSGSFNKAEQSSYTMQTQFGEAAGTFVRVTYLSTFSQRVLTEVFTWRLQDGRPFLYYYDAR